MLYKTFYTTDCKNDRIFDLSTITKCLSGLFTKHHFTGFYLPSGRGIIATEGFCKGDFLLTYTGELLDKNEAEERETTYKEKHGSYMFFFVHNGTRLW